MSVEPKVSIIVPVHDTPKDYLEECVNSVLRQTYQNWELILINDHSNTATERVLLTLKTDSRVSLIANSGQGGGKQYKECWHRVCHRNINNVSRQ